MRIHAAALALTAALVPLSAYPKTHPRHRPTRRRRTPAAAAAAGHRNPRCGPTIASSRRKRSPTRESSPFIASRIGSTTRFPRTDSGKSSCGSARLPRRRSVPGTADRPQAIASSSGSGEGPHPASERVLRGRGGRLDADLEGGPGGELRFDPLLRHLLSGD